MGGPTAGAVTVTEQGITDRKASYDEPMTWVVSVSGKVVTIQLNGGAHFGRKHLLLPSRKADKAAKILPGGDADTYIDGKMKRRLAHRLVSAEYGSLPGSIATQKTKIIDTGGRIAALLANADPRKKEQVARQIANERTILATQQAKLKTLEAAQVQMQAEPRAARWSDKYHGGAKKNTVLNLVTQSQKSIDPKRAAEKLARALLALPAGALNTTSHVEVDFECTCVHNIEYDANTDTYAATGYGTKLKVLVKRIAVDAAAPAFEVVHLEG